MRCAWCYGFAAVAAVCLLAAPVMADVTIIGDRGSGCDTDKPPGATLWLAMQTGHGE